MSLIVSTGTPLWTISSMTERTTSARRAVSRRSGISGRFSMSGTLFGPSRDRSGDAWTSLAGDELLEKVGHAECEQIDGLVQRGRSPQGFIGQPPTCISPSGWESRCGILSHTVGGSARDARWLTHGGPPVNPGRPSLSQDSRMSDIDPGLDALRLGDDAIPPAREGLPPRYRMRADAHYVEQLDSGLLNSPIRFLEVHGLESPRQDDEEAPAAAFVESIRKHGVLQPLLVRSRGGRHLVIAGRKRLAAAAAAGLSRVPCLIERVDDDQAPILAAATNTPSSDKTVPRIAAPAPVPVPTADLTFAAFADCLTA